MDWKLKPNLYFKMLNLLLTPIKFAFARISEAIKYVIHVSGAVLVSMAIVPPIAILTQWLLVAFGVVMVAPPGGGMEELTQLSPRDLALAMMVVGIIEESYFRYLVMDCLFMRWLKMPFIMAALISSVSFGCAHLLNPGGIPYTIPQAVGTAFGGLWFAYLYKKKGLHFSMVTHAFYNFAVVMLSHLL